MGKSRKELKKSVLLLNPRASTAWSKDDSKFGQRMLEKMGWKKGQGLGANSQGVTENIKFRVKLDSEGLGFKIRDDQLMQVEHGFTAVLSNLKDNGNISIKNENPEAPRSLESKSMVSRSRVHYHKFTRGKDVSRYDEKDLAGIIGLNTKIDIKKNIKDDCDIDSKFSDTHTILEEERDSSIINEEEFISTVKKNKRKSNQLTDSTLETNEIIHYEPKSKKRKKEKRKNDDCSSYNELQNSQFELYLEESSNSVSKNKSELKIEEQNKVENISYSIKSTKCKIANVVTDDGTNGMNTDEVEHQSKGDIMEQFAQDETESFTTKTKSKSENKNGRKTHLKQSSEDNNCETVIKCVDNLEVKSGKSQHKKRRRKSLNNVEKLVNTIEINNSNSSDERLNGKKYLDELDDTVFLNNTINESASIESKTKSKTERNKLEETEGRIKCKSQSALDVEKKECRNVPELESKTCSVQLEVSQPEESFTSVFPRKLTKAERIIEKTRLLKKLQQENANHEFTGSNLTHISGYGNCIMKKVNNNCCDISNSSVK